MNLSELSFDRLGSWPVRVRIYSLLGLFIFTLSLGYIFMIKPRLTNLHNLEKQQIDLKSRYQNEYKQAIALSEYEKQLSSTQQSIASSSKKFSTVNKISQLLSAISNLATENNIEMNSIKPEQETAQEFYETIPISISVTGDYHHLALFISQVESLQNTITVNDFTLTPFNDKKREDSGTTVLNMTATITIHILNVPEDNNADITHKIQSALVKAG